MLLLIAASYGLSALHSSSVRTALPDADIQEPMSAKHGRPSRPVYPYSVIRGGIYSGAEMIHAVESDPVAATHYSGFDLRRLRAVESPFTRPVYVSYRIGDQIYWTHHPILLLPNERLITDGTLYARARCGNRVAFEPQTPVAKSEPPRDLLDTILPELAFPPLIAEDAPLSELATDIIRPPLAAPEASPIQVVPEPGTVVLLGSVLAMFLFATWKRTGAIQTPTHDQNGPAPHSDSK